MTLPDGAKPVLMLDARAAAERAAQHGGTVKPAVMNIDTAPFHGRLWSVGDSPLVYYATHFAESRRLKKDLMRRWLELHVTRFPAEPAP